MPPLACSMMPFLIRDGAGERAPRVAEELGFEQRLGDRAAIDGDKRPRRARAVAVNRAGHQLLARAAFAEDEHGRR